MPAEPRRRLVACWSDTPALSQEDPARLQLMQVDSLWNSCCPPMRKSSGLWEMDPRNGSWNRWLPPLIGIDVERQPWGRPLSV